MQNQSFKVVTVGIAVLVFSLMTCDNAGLGNVGLGKVVDTQAPTAEIVEPLPGSFIKGDQLFKIKAEDDVGLAKDNPVFIAFVDELNAYEAAVKAGNNSVNDPWRPAVYDPSDKLYHIIIDTPLITNSVDGQYAFKIKARDESGQPPFVSSDLVYTVKNGVPTVELLIPKLDWNELESNPENVPEVLNSGFLSGVASDLQGVAPGNPLLKFWKDGEAEPDLWKELPDGGGEGKSFAFRYYTSKDGFETSESKDYLEKGLYRVKFKITDTNGLVAFYPSEEDSALIRVTDTEEPPKITIDKLDSQQQNGEFVIKATVTHSVGVTTEQTDAFSDSATNLTFTKNEVKYWIPWNTITVDGNEGDHKVVFESSPIKPRISTNLAIVAGEGEGGVTSFTFPDDIYNFDVEARSIRGDKASASYANITIDTVAPSVEITGVTPTVTESGDTYTVNGITRLNFNVSDSEGIGEDNNRRQIKYLVSSDGTLTDAAAVYNNADAIFVDALVNVPSLNYNDGKSGSVKVKSTELKSLYIDTRKRTDKTDTYLYIAAQDRAGNIGVSKTTFRVDQDTDAPSITFTDIDTTINTIDALLGKTPANLFGADVKIRGAFSDDDRIDTTNAKLVIWKEGAESDRKESVLSGLIGTGTVNFNVTSQTLGGIFNNGTPIDLAEGIYFFTLEVSDSTSGDFAITPAKTTLVGPYCFAVDTDDPKISVSTPTRGSYQSSTFTLAGTISDHSNKNNDQPPRLTVAAKVITLAEDAYNAETGEWEWAYTVDGIDTDNNTVRIVANDRFNKERIDDFKVEFDNIAPIVTIRQPSINNWFEGVTTSFGGSLNDNSDKVLQKVYYYIMKPGVSAPPAIPASPLDTAKEEAAIQSGWGEAVISGGSWSAVVDLSDDAVAKEGANVLYVIGYDVAGNGPDRDPNQTHWSNEKPVWSSSWAGDVPTNNTAAAMLTFNVDRSAPNASGLKFYKDSDSEHTEALADKSFIKETFTLSGVVTDSNELDTLVVKQNGVEITLTGTELVKTSGKSWTVNLALPRLSASLTKPDGVYVYTIEVTDKSQGLNHKDTLTQTVTVDTSGPVVEITSPAEEALFSTASTTVTGSADDTLNGAGVSKVYFRIGAESYEVPAGEIDSGWTQADGTSQWSKTGVNIGSEGALKLTAFAEDVLGNRGAAVVHNFYVDLSAPDASGLKFHKISDLATALADKSFIKETFTLSGIVTDSNELDTLVVKQNGVEIALTTTELVKTSGKSWVVNLTLPRDSSVGGLTTPLVETEGVYVYTIEVTDKSRGLNPTVTLTQTVTVDTSGPTVEITSPAEDEPFNTASITVTGNADDMLNDTDAGAGVSKVYFRIGTIGYEAPGNAITIDETEWTQANGTSQWSKTGVNIGTIEGALKLTAFAEDVLGNRGAAVVQNFYVDASNPEILDEDYSGITEKYAKGVFTIKFTAFDSNILNTDESKTLNVGTSEESVKLAGVVIRRTSGGVSTEVFNSYTVSNGFATPVGDTYTDAHGNMLTVSGTSYMGVLNARTPTIDTYSKDKVWGVTLKQNDATKIDDTISGSLGNGTYDYVITVTDAGGRSASKTVTVTVDTSPPEIDVTGVTPTVTESGDTYTVNSITRLNFNVSDNEGIGDDNSDGYAKRQIKYLISTVGTLTDAAAVYNNADAVFVDALNLNYNDGKSGSVKVKSTEPKSLYIDTRKLTDKADTYLYIAAQDRAGNASVSKTTFSVDQDTDAPSITFTDIDTTISSINDLLAHTSTNLFGADVKIRGTFTDDDAIDTANVKLVIWKEGEENNKKENVLSGLTGAGTVNFNITSQTLGGIFNTGTPIDLPEGVYFFTLEVRDFTSGDFAVTPAKTTTVGPYCFAVDADDPKISVLTPTRGSYQSSTFTLTGTISDHSNKNKGQPPRLTVKDPKHTSAEAVSLAESAYNEGTGEWAWTYIVDGIDAVNNTVRIVANDRFNKERIDDFKVEFDDIAPTVTIKQPVLNKWFEGITTSFGGSLNDDSGKVLQKVYYYIMKPGVVAPPAIPASPLDAAKEEAAIQSGWGEAVINGGSWSVMVDLSDDAVAKEGANVLYVIGYDVAGNGPDMSKSLDENKTHWENENDKPVWSGSWASDVPSNNTAAAMMTFSVDRSAPDTSGLKFYKASDTTHTAALADKAFIKETFTLSGVVTDSNELESLIVKQNGEAITLTETELVKTNGTSWTVNLALPRLTTPLTDAEGIYVYTIEVADKSQGLTHGVTLTRTITVDTSGPTVEITSPAENEPFNTASITVTGSADDTLNGGNAGAGVSKVYFRIGAVDVDYGVPTDEIDSGWTQANGTSQWSKTSVSVGTIEGALKLTAFAEDVLGNRGGAVVQNFYVDASNPEILDEEYSGITEKYAKGAFKIKFTAFDSNILNTDESKTLNAGTSEESVKLAGVVIRRTSGGVSTEVFNSYTVSNGFATLNDDTYTDAHGNMLTISGAYTGTLNGRTPAINAYSKEKVWGVTLAQNDAAKGDDTISGSLGNGTYDYVITVTDAGGRSTSKTVTVTVDSSPPEIDITGVTPTVTESGGTYTVNSITRLNFNVSDNEGIGDDNSDDYAKRQIKYLISTEGALTDAAAVYNNADAVFVDALVDTANLNYNDGKSGSVKVKSTESKSLYIDTRKLTDKADTYLYIAAQDRAGNTSVSKTTFYVDQDTDAPSITFTDIDPTISSINDLLSKTPTNLFGADVKIRGTFSDDDAIDTTNAKLAIWKEGEENEKKESVLSGLTGAGAVNFNITSQTLGGIFNNETPIDLPEGVYFFTLEVSDSTSGDFAVTPAKTTTMGPYCFAVDTDDPKISVSTPTRGSYQSSTFTLTGTISDNSNKNKNQPPRLTVKDPKHTSAEAVSLAESAYNEGTGEWAWTYIVDGIDAINNTVRIVANDRFNKERIDDFKVEFDDTAPVVTIKQPVLNNWFEGITTSFGGFLSDNSGKVLQKVYYYIMKPGVVAPPAIPASPLDAAKEEAAIQSGWGEAVINGGSWSVMVDLSTDEVAKEGANVLYVIGYDVAGNGPDRDQTHWSDEKPVWSGSWASDVPTSNTAAAMLTFNVDRSAPDASGLKFYKTTDSEYTEALADKSFIKETFTLSGVVEDSNELDTLVVKQNGEEITLTETELVKTSGKSWAVNLALPRDSSDLTASLTEPEGIYVYTIEVADKSQGLNHKVALTRTITVDTSGPTVEITSPAENEPFNTASITVTGSADDTLNDGNAGAGVSKVYFRVGTIGYEVPEGTITIGANDWTQANGTSQWSKTSVSIGSIEGALKLTAFAEDVLGNRGAAVVRDFSVDASNPEILDEEYNNGEISPEKYAKGAFEIKFTTFDSNMLNADESNSNGTDKLAGVVVRRINGGDSEEVFNSYTVSGGFAALNDSDTYTDAHGNMLTVSGTYMGVLTTRASAINTYSKEKVWGVTLVQNDAAKTDDTISGRLENGIYDYIITVTDTVGRITSKTVTITIDREKPSIDVTRFTSLVNRDLGEGVLDYVNGVIQFAVSASDENGLAATHPLQYWVLPQGASFTAPSTAAEWEAAGGVFFERGVQPLIDTENGSDNQSTFASATANTGQTPQSFVDDTAYVLYIGAMDKAGNIGVTAYNTDDYADYSFIINQETDKPFVTITSPDADAHVGKSHLVQGVLTDDDGFKAGADNSERISIAYSYNGTSDWSAVTGTITTTKITDFEYNFTYSVADIGDAHIWVRVTAKDDEAKKLSMDADHPAAQATAEKTINFTIDSTPPVIVVEVEAEKDTFKEDFTLKGYFIERNYKDESLAVSINGGAKGTITPVKADDFTTTDRWNWTYNVELDDLKDGVNTIELEVYDQRGQVHRTSAVVNKDTTAPTATISEFKNFVTRVSEADGKNEYLVNGVVKWTAIASDNLGVKETRYWLLPKTANDTDEGTRVEGLESAMSAAADGAVNGTAFTGGDVFIDTVSGQDNQATPVAIADAGTEYTLYVGVSDKAGNVFIYTYLPNETADYSFKVDQTTDTPTWTFDNLDAEGASANFLASSSILSGTVVDDDGFAGAASLVVQFASDKDGDWETQTGFTPTRTTIGTREIRWSTPLPSGIADGVYYLRLKATDDGAKKVGAAEVDKTFESESMEFTVDSTPPVIAVEAGEDTFKEDFTLTGHFIERNYKDGSLAVSINGEAKGTITPEKAGDFTTTDKWNWTYDVELTNLKDGVNTIELEVYDQRGQVHRTSVVVNKDTTAPTAAISEFKNFVTVSVAGGKSEYLVNGVVKWTAITSDNLGVKETRYWLLPKTADTTDEDARVTALENAMDEEADSAGNGTVFTGREVFIDTVNGQDNQATPVAIADAGAEYTLYVGVSDKAGNVFIYTYLPNADTDYSFKVDQATDTPTWTFDNLDAVDTTKNFIAGGTLSGTVVDDDGFAGEASLVVEFTSDTDDDGNPKFTSDTDDGGSPGDGETQTGFTPTLTVIGTREIRWSTSLPDGIADGVHYLRLKATDDRTKKVGDAEGDVTFKSAPVKFTLDQTPPKPVIVTVGNTDGTIAETVKTAPSIKGTLEETNPLSLTLTVKNSAGDTVAEGKFNAAQLETQLTEDAGAWEWVWTGVTFGDLPDGLYTVVVDAIDKVNTQEHSRTVQTVFNKDVEGPTVSFSNLTQEVVLSRELMLEVADTSDGSNDYTGWTAHGLTGTPTNADIHAEAVKVYNESRAVITGETPTDTKMIITDIIRNTDANLRGTFADEYSNVARFEYRFDTDPYDADYPDDIAKTLWRAGSELGNVKNTNWVIPIPAKDAVESSTPYTAESTYPVKDGVRRVSIRVYDTLGNMNNEKADIAFYLDREGPKFALDKLLDESPSGNDTDGTIYSLVGIENDTDTVFTLKGSVSDANIDKLTVTGVDGVSLVASNETEGGKDFSITVTKAQFAALAEGSHTFTLNAVDVALNSAEQKWTFIKDTAPPENNFLNMGDQLISNTENEPFIFGDTSAKIMGSTSDATSGVKSLTYTLQAYEETENGMEWTNKAENQALPPGSSTWNIVLGSGTGGLGLADGHYRIKVTAEDNAKKAGGDASSNKTVNGTPVEETAFPEWIHFVLDTINPELVIEPTKPYYNGDVFLQGTAKDGNGIDKVEVWFTSASASKQTLAATDVTVADNGEWSIAITMPITGLEEKQQTINVTAYDKAGHTTTLQKEFTLDKTAPNGVAVQQPNKSGERVIGPLTVRGVASDNNSVAKVFYQIGKTDTLETTTIVKDQVYTIKTVGTFDWTSVGAPTGAAEGTGFIATANGTVDNGGNATTWKDTKVDTTGVVIDDGGLKITWSGGVYSWNVAFNELKFLVNSSGAAAFDNTRSGKYGLTRYRYTSTTNDTLIEYAGENANDNGLSDEPENNVWDVPINVLAFDSAGNATVCEFYITVDPHMDKAASSILTPDGSQAVGGAVRLTGMSSDNNTVNSVWVRVSGATHTDSEVYVDGDIAKGYKDWDFTEWKLAYANSANDKWYDWTTDWSSSPDANTTYAGTADTELHKAMDVGWHSATLQSPGSGLVNWYINLNANGKLNPPTGTPKRVVYIEVFARDTKSTEGYTIEQESVNGYITRHILEFSNNVPIIENIKVTAADGTEVDYSYQMQISKTVTIEADVKDSDGITEIKVQPTGALSGTSVLTATNLVIDKLKVTTTPPIDMQANDEGFYVYHIKMELDSANLFMDTTGTYGLTLSVTDAEQTPLTSSFTMSFQIDNFFPRTTYTSAVTAVGDYTLRGTANDAPPSGSIQGLKSVVVYFSRTVNGATAYYMPRATKSGDVITHEVSIEDSDRIKVNAKKWNGTTLGNLEQVEYPAEGYGIVIDSDESATGEKDGDNFVEYWYDGAGSEKVWGATFDTRVINDGKITVHYIAEDRAGNKTYSEQEVYFQNHAPSITSLTLGTPLFGATMGTRTVSDRYLDTQFTVRNDKFSIGLDVSGGNGDKKYRARYLTRSSLPVTSITLGRIYTVAQTNAGFDFKTIGAKDNVIGAPFVATRSASAGDLNGASAFEYTESSIAKEGNAVDVVENNTATADIEFSDTDFDTIEDSGAYAVVKAGGTLEQGRRYRIEEMGDTAWTTLVGLVNAEKGSTFIPSANVTLTGTGVAVTSNDRYFSIKVWDTTLEGTDNEDEQLSDFALLAVRVENEDTRPPIAQLYDLNPKAESTITASVNPVETTTKSVQNTTKGSLYMAGGKISGHIEPRDGRDIENDAMNTDKANIWLEHELNEDGSEKTPVVIKPTGFAKDTVSGVVTLRGRAQDDQRIDAIYLNFGESGRLKILEADTDGQLKRVASLPENAIGLYQELGIDGHIVEWTYRWDSGTLIDGVTTATLGDVTVTVQAEDASASSGNGGVSEPRANTADNADYNSIELTLAPYITTLTRFKNSSGVTDADKAPVLRSKNGWFSFRRSVQNVATEAERMQVEGFNLGDTNQSVSIKDTSGGMVTPNGNYYYIEIPADATSGIVTYKAGTNSVEAVNNRNNNANSWNTSQEAIAGNESSALWNDDRAVHLFDSHNETTGDHQGHFRDPTVVGSIVKPAMTIDPATGRLWASWSSYMINSAAVSSTTGGGTGSVFMPMYFSHNGGVENPVNARPVSWDMDPSEDTDIAWNTTNNRRSIVYLANYMTSGYGDGGLAFWDNANGARGMAGDLAHTSGDSTYTPPNGKVIERFDSLGNRQLMQFINPRIANNGNVSHIAYYDTKYRILRYWNTQKGGAEALKNAPGIVVEGDRPVTRSLNFDQDSDWQPNITKQTGYLHRQGVDREVEVLDKLAYPNGDIARLRANESQTNAESPLYARLWAPIAGKMVFLRANSLSQNWIDDITAPIAEITPHQSADAEDAGNYNAIDVNSAGIPIIAYLVQDKAEGTETLKYAYGDTADATYFTPVDIAISGISTAGRYVSMRIDKDAATGRKDVMHITFMDSDNGDLVYIKGTPTGTSGAYTFAAPVVIDSVGNVGKWADIAIDADGNPVISYLDQGGIDSRTGLKMAFYDPANGGNGWEYVTLPGRYAVNDVRTQVECDPRTTGRSWDAAFAYVSGDYYRISYYVK